ncbi:uncharacterized protein LOC110944337 [Helianthus annuus]|uniref:uncharacterized protein LOC110944337 n=1 Tax=Helianthus annuus TaxID=4232 RepID=UPI000B8F06D5|nr:uncharacterized protein LOC110944337 [Helianthus annuus]
MEIEPNPGDQIPTPAFDLVEIPRVPAPHPPDYDPWFNDHRDYPELHPQEEPMQNPVAPYPNLDPLDPYWDNDQYIREILENPYPYEEPMPQYPDPIPTPAPPMSTENVQELRTFGEELLDESEKIRQIGERHMDNEVNQENQNNDNNGNQIDNSAIQHIVPQGIIDAMPHIIKTVKEADNNKSNSGSKRPPLNLVTA